MTSPDSIDDLDAALAKAYGANPRTPIAEAKARRAREKRVVNPNDGRRAKFTGRTVQFNVKMKPDLKMRIVQASRAHGLPMAVFAEQAFEAFIKSLQAKGGKGA